MKWIVDAASGRRVKLTCVNWPGHLHAMVPEGLHKKPLTHIAAFVSSMGFNCVRLTWATYMFTRPYFTNLTVEQSLDRWGLEEARAGLTQNNPGLLGLTLVEAQKALVSGLGAQKIMVVLDNHVSYPKWCCHGSDGNGFFGDEYFDPGEWLMGLTTVAKLYKDEPTVVAMSMRNEFRGPRQNENDWYQYIEMGSTAIHKESPNVLVIVSGLSFATNLGFLKKKPLALNLTSKLVYEAHWYSFSNPTHKWLFQTNGFCATATQWFTDQSGFLISGPNPVPLFVSEFGVDQRGVNERDNRYLGCLLAHLAENDMDWALWTLQGSYMLREGRVGMEEMYGLLDAEWAHVRDPKMLDKLQLVQQMTQDPNSKHPTLYIMYHPQSGQCARGGKNGIYLSDCRRTSKWSHDRNGSPIRLKGTSRCLTIAGDGLPAILSSNCSSDRSTWGSVSDSKLHMAAKDEQGRYLCLEWSSLNFSAILTKKVSLLGR
ncbi:cellulase (glycosyl hydrolase family 5) protein [Actinidia rufa]|uniref:Cellulase (Glycosyl hydrolase family 5) protein n=1 Tax=Actinidia rufa TaxID=165716 RepID=A0A7J0H032_9ERIC|nr:cellulase (glycosyl hydrolase family 5) protein [Actinidia rufa]